MVFLLKSKENVCFSLRNVVLLVMGVFLSFIASQIWLPSIFILIFAVFLFDLPWFLKYLLVGIILFLVLFDFSGYALRSVTQGVGVNAVSEEIPLVGIVFILPILHFWKRMPIELKFYGIFLIVVGVVKSKYMFLATIPLILGLMFKEDIEPLQIRNFKIPVWFMVGYLGIGWLFMSLFMLPTGIDLVEMKEAIHLAQDKKVVLYNDWGDGWTFVSLGYDTNYKISPPEPDWNNLVKPFVAYTKTQLDCNKISNKIFIC